MALKVVKGNARGKVQGVWFRRFVQQNAEANGVRGYAENLSDGSVDVLLIGDVEVVSTVQMKVAEGPPDARVSEVVWSELSTVPDLEEELSGFSVR